MTNNEQARFEKLYQRHLTELKLQGMRPKTIDGYARAVRRVTEHFGLCPDQLNPTLLKTYFAELIDSHSWSTVKLDRSRTSDTRIFPSLHRGPARMRRPSGELWIPGAFRGLDANRLLCLGHLRFGKQPVPALDGVQKARAAASCQ